MMFCFRFFQGVDVVGIPRPSISRFFNSLKHSIWSRLISNAESSSPTVPKSPQLVWAFDDAGRPIFASEFVSGLSLTHRIAIFNPGSLPLRVVKLGFLRSPPTEYEERDAYLQCQQRLLGFSVSLLTSDSNRNDDNGRFLKPGDHQWLEIVYTPDYLQSLVRVQLVVFVSLKSPSASTMNEFDVDRKRIFLTPNDDRPACNESLECDLFQLTSTELTARISAPLVKLCHSSVVRPSIEDSLW